MTEEERPDEAGLTPKELEEQTAEELPDRAAMTVVDASVTIPIDPAIAADVLAGEPFEGAEADEGAEAEEEEEEGGGNG
jgi:hypothetical protein